MLRNGTLRLASATVLVLLVVPIMLVGVAGFEDRAKAKLPPLRDPVFLNIGFVCKWRDGCIARQRSAMKKALAYVDKRDPPAWKVQLCNRNASRFRGRGRVDWIGFNNCIRNKSIRSPAIRRR